MISLLAKPSSVSFGPATVTFHARAKRNEAFFEYFAIADESLVIVTVTSRSAANEPRRNTLSERHHKDASGYFSVTRSGVFQHLGVEIVDDEFSSLRNAVVSAMAAPKSLMWEVSFGCECVSKSIRDDVWKLTGHHRISLGEAE